jgi:hypothetical protein
MSDIVDTLVSADTFTSGKKKIIRPNLYFNNETVRCDYISTILHTAVSLLDGLIISPQ